MEKTRVSVRYGRGGSEGDTGDCPYYENQPKFLNQIKKGVVMDANMLVLCLIGIVDARKNTNYLKEFEFTYDDYVLFTRFIQAMKIDKLIVTPHVLTEFFNLAENRIGKWFFPKNFGEIKEFLKSFLENHCKKDELMEIPKFDAFGFADVSMYLTSKNNGYNAITSDTELLHFCRGNTGNIIISLDELRAMRAVSR